MLVALTLVVALAAAVAAWGTGAVVFAWVALGLAAAVLVALVVRMLRCRRTSVGTADTADSAEAPAWPAGTEPAAEESTAEEPAEKPAAAEPALEEPAEKPAAVEAAAAAPRAGRPAEPAAVVATASTGAPESGHGIVHVQPGRRRYHRPGCEIIVGRDTDGIALEDAQDEGLSACSVCYLVQAHR